jgi:hypothetical protein
VAARHTHSADFANLAYPFQTHSGITADVIDTSGLKTFKISNGALQSDRLPNRLKVFGWGDNDSTDGVYRAGDKTAAVMSANQKAGGYERVAIDFDHCSVAGTATNKQLMAAGQPPLIFGYGTVAVKPGDGIYLEDIAWTPLGVQHAKNFEDISPALKDDNREVTLIHSVALTPNGKVTGLQFFSTSTTNTMELKPENVLLISELAPAIGLAATATKAEILSRLGIVALLSSSCTIADGKITALFGAQMKDGKLVLLSTAPSLENRLKLLEEAGANKVVLLSATINGEKKDFTGEDLVKVLSKVESLEKKFTDRETAEVDFARDNVIKLFSVEGKVPKKADGGNYSADELKKLDVPTLRLLHANTPVTVPLSARNATSQTDGKTGSFRDPKTGIVDMAALMNAENAAAGNA